MSDLREIAQLAWQQVFPNPGNETKITREQFLATAKSEYAYLMWKKIKEDKAEYGECDIPSYLLAEKELPIENNVMDISELEIIRSIDLELWLQDIKGSEDCKCSYIKSTLNKNKALCDDDSIPDESKTFYPLGKKIIFPRGTHDNKLTLVYAKSGQELDETIPVDDAIGGIIRRSLVEIYAGKTGDEDKKNDTNPNT